MSERKCSVCFSTEHDKRWHKKRLNLLTVDDVTYFVRMHLEAWARARDKYRVSSLPIQPRMHWSAYLEIIAGWLGESCIIGGPEHLFKEIVGVEIGEYGQKTETRKCVFCGKETERLPFFIVRAGDKKMKVPRTQGHIKE